MSHQFERTPLRESLSYHRLAGPKVAQRIVASTGLAPPGTVVEIGPGDGLLTAALLATGAHVIAVERDRELAAAVARQFVREGRLRVVCGDFRDFPLPPRTPYRVVANPPFSLTSQLIRQLLSAKNPPVEACLVVQREAALRWGGFHEESIASLRAKVRFTLEVRLALRRRDFRPFPAVDCVLLAIGRRDRPLFSADEERRFAGLVEEGFAGGHRTLRRNLERWIPYARFKTLAREAGFGLDAVPRDLTFDQWVALFRASKQRV